MERTRPKTFRSGRQVVTPTLPKYTADVSPRNFISASTHIDSSGLQAGPLGFCPRSSRTSYQYPHPVIRHLRTLTLLLPGSAVTHYLARRRASCHVPPPARPSVVASSHRSSAVPSGSHNICRVRSLSSLHTGVDDKTPEHQQRRSTVPQTEVPSCPIGRLGGAR